MKLIVGLGNIGREYENTYHNIGFMCADKTAEMLNAEFTKEKFRSILAETKIGGEKVVIAKPKTYMNLSGTAIREMVDFYKTETKDLLVLYDDFDLKLGSVRIRESGSAGTHNGMRNVVSELGTEDFPRIRVGFKPETDITLPLIDFVLSGIDKDAKSVLEKAIIKASEAAAEFARGATVREIMQKYNGNTD
ncbi:MAG: aminoacyl-tRNA hydrolase [Clostridia bacterium]|nr:aminoacyl-tRNA hydrolase [Clostridia bacterium]